jgi:hypothetical protein
VDVVALNVLRRTAAYSCRLRLFEGGTFTVRSVVITAGVTWRRPGVPAPAVRRKALASAAAGVGVPRRQGRAKIIPDGGATGIGLLAVTSDQQVLCCRVTGGCGGRCWRRARAACSVNLAGGVIRAGGST